MKLLRFVRHLVFNASRHGRCAEIAGWSNGLAAAGFGGGAFLLTKSAVAVVVVAAVAFVLLRAALTHRASLWVAACCGTLAVAAAGGGLAWLFGHVVESWSAAPWIALVLGAVSAGAVPAWAYRRLAELRADGVRDSLVHPVSVPSSSRG